MLIKMVEVGMYWKTVKGRFNRGATQRNYLAMKYGYKWLSRINTRCGKLLIVERTLKQICLKKELLKQLEAQMGKAIDRETKEILRVKILEVGMELK